MNAESLTAAHRTLRFGQSACDEQKQWPFCDCDYQRSRPLCARQGHRCYACGGTGARIFRSHASHSQRHSIGHVLILDHSPRGAETITNQPRHPMVNPLNSIDVHRRRNGTVARVGVDWRRLLMAPGWFTQAGARSHPFVIPGVIRIKGARATCNCWRRKAKALADVTKNALFEPKRRPLRNKDWNLSSRHRLSRCNFPQERALSRHIAERV